ncbi:MAG: hypothetical protein AAGA16_07415 [Cyanobacteria bacterium P01_E01_bin.35]
MNRFDIHHFGQEKLIGLNPEIILRSTAIASNVPTREIQVFDGK